MEKEVLDAVNEVKDRKAFLERLYGSVGMVSETVKGMFLI